MQLFYKILSVLNSISGRNLISYLVFVTISAIFWLLLTLNNEIQEDFNVKINVINVPDSVTIIKEFPREINVSVRDKGSSFFKYSFGKEPSVDINIKQYINNSGRITIPNVELKNIVSKAFGSGVEMLNIIPDTLNCTYTTLPGKKVPVVLNVSAEPNYRYVINGRIVSTIDSVCVYSSREILNRITSVSTTAIKEDDLRDTLRIIASIICPPDARTIPSEAQIVIPVEPLITKKVTIPITPVNVPKGMSLVTFPSNVDAQYLVPASEYKSPQEINVNCRFDNVDKNVLKLPLEISTANWKYSEPILSIDSVEYIIETL